MISKCLHKIEKDQATGVLIVPFLENPSVVLSTNEPISGQSLSITSSGQLANSPSYGCPTPTQEKNEIVGMQTIRSSIMQTYVSSKTADIIMQSWSKRSIKQYSTSLRTWSVLCGKWNINPYDPPVTRVLDYLTSLFERGLSYDAINTAKSAISAITSPRNGISLGCQPLISRFMKGIFKSRPPVPRYESMGHPTYAITPCILWTSKRNRPKITHSQACCVDSSCVITKNSKHSVTGFIFYEDEHGRSGICYSRAY